MSTSDFVTNGPAGANLHLRSSSANFALGQTARGTNNTAWLYVKASGAVATGTCTVASATFLATDASGPFTADVALATGEYGWVRLTAEDI